MVYAIEKNGLFYDIVLKKNKDIIQVVCTTNNKQKAYRLLNKLSFKVAARKNARERKYKKQKMMTE